MSLIMEQRSVAQSDQDVIRILGPTPMETPLQSTRTEGCYKILGIRPGLTVSLFDIEVGCDFAGRFSTEPCVAIDVLFEAVGQGWILDDDDERLGSVAYRPGRLYLMVAKEGAKGLYDVPVGSRFKGIDIRVDIRLWEKLGAKDTIDILGDSHPLHASSGNETWVGVLPLSPQIIGIARSLFESGMKGGDDLNLEARCLDIVTMAISSLRQPKSSFTVSARDRRPLQHVRELMFADLAHSWTLSELAREAGISETRLKTGFRVAHGLPVYGFLQEARLTEAKRLLEAGGMSITEVALSIGYASVSHFSSLFNRRFGIQPSKVGQLAFDCRNTNAP